MGTLTSNTPEELPQGSSPSTTADSGTQEGLSEVHAEEGVPAARLGGDEDQTAGSGGTSGGIPAIGSSSSTLNEEPTSAPLVGGIAQRASEDPNEAMDRDDFLRGDRDETVTEDQHSEHTADSPEKPPPLLFGGREITPAGELELPDLEFVPVEIEQARPQADRNEPRPLLSGTWEEVAPVSGAADFAPGGYDRRVIGVDAVNGRFIVIQWHGPVRISGEFKVELRDSEARLGVSESGPSSFDHHEQPLNRMGIDYQRPRALEGRALAV